MRFRPSGLLLAVFRFLLPPTLIGLVYLYFYPILSGCAFPPTKRAEAGCVVPGKEKPSTPAQQAPFRLLALADPQLEGDTSVPDAALSWEGIERAWQDGSVWAGVLGEVGKVGQRWRKQLDLWGNDRYLAHLFRSMHWWTGPTHVVVLGDLLGSQWIGDKEFETRRERFWRTVFGHMEMVPESIMGSSGRAAEDMGSGLWKRRIMAVAGNHDVGYAGDLNSGRMERFEKGFGRANWEVRFRLDGNQSAATSHSGIGHGLGLDAFLDQPPELRLVVLNSMNLDGPAWDTTLQQQSWDFLDDTLLNPPTPPHSKAGTILLTHVPFHKPEGVCVDAPYFSYFPSSQGGGIQEQNHLSEDTSAKILNSLKQAQGGAIVLNGHDHEGCDTIHTSSSSSSWSSKHYLTPTTNPADGLREITVRSMMGDFGGNAGMLSAWFSEESGKWEFAYESCMFGVQHIWWGIWVLVVVEGLLGIAGAGLWVLEEMDGRRERGAQKLKKG